MTCKPILLSDKIRPEIKNIGDDYTCLADGTSHSFLNIEG